MGVTDIRPETEGEVYSNFDHRMDEKIVAILHEEVHHAQHAAWDFCGYVYKSGARWFEEVWVYNTHQTTLSGDTVEDVIREANEQFGNG